MKPNINAYVVIGIIAIIVGFISNWIAINYTVLSVFVVEKTDISIPSGKFISIRNMHDSTVILIPATADIEEGAKLYLERKPILQQIVTDLFLTDASIKSTGM